MRLDHYCSDNETDAEKREIRLMKNARDLLELSWERLEPESLLIGKSLRQLDLRRSTGVSIVGVLRDGDFTTNPSAEFAFQQGDMLAIIGSPSQRTAIHGLAQTGQVQ